MTDREFWEVVWRALRMVEKAIAKKHGFGEYRATELPQSVNSVTQEIENVI